MIYGGVYRNRSHVRSIVTVASHINRHDLDNPCATCAGTKVALESVDRKTETVLDTCFKLLFRCLIFPGFLPEVLCYTHVLYRLYLTSVFRLFLSVPPRIVYELTKKILTMYLNSLRHRSTIFLAIGLDWDNQRRGRSLVAQVWCPYPCPMLWLSRLWLRLELLRCHAFLGTLTACVVTNCYLQDILLAAPQPPFQAPWRVPAEC